MTPIETPRPKNHCLFLKIKIKSLAAEAKIIRHAEKRKGPLREQLYLHRIHVVRKAARSAQLAYGFLRGRDYRSIEPVVDKWNPPDWHEVGVLVKKYGLQGWGKEHDAAKALEAQLLQAWYATAANKAA